MPLHIILNDSKNWTHQLSYLIFESARHTGYEVLFCSQSWIVQKFRPTGGGGLALAASVHPVSPHGADIRRWPDPGTMCRPHVRFLNTAVRGLQTPQSQSEGWSVHAGTNENEFIVSIQLTLYSGRSSSSASDFKACRTVCCSAHIISSHLKYTALLQGWSKDELSEEFLQR